MNLSEIKRMFPIIWNAFRRNRGELGYTPNYKVCTLHLSHTWGVPVATIGENTLGATITWTEDVPGVQTGIFYGTFTENVLTEGKTFIFYSIGLENGYTFHVSRNSTNFIGISYRQNGIGAGGFEVDIQIIVYN